MSSEKNLRLLGEDEIAGFVPADFYGYGSMTRIISHKLDSMSINSTWFFLETGEKVFVNRMLAYGRSTDNVKVLKEWGTALDRARVAEALAGKVVEWFENGGSKFCRMFRLAQGEHSYLVQCNWYQKKSVEQYVTPEVFLVDNAESSFGDDELLTPMVLDRLRQSS